MDRIEKIVMTVSGGMLLAFFGALVFAASGLGIDVPDCITTRKPFTEGQEAIKLSDNPPRYEAHVVARMWSFDPPEIVIPPHTELDMYLTSSDIVHGYFVQGTNINLMAVPGAVTYRRVKFDREGEYLVLCHEYCGTAHHIMAGKITVSTISREQQ